MGMRGASSRILRPVIKTADFARADNYGFKNFLFRP
jgi:hypothetical protein